MEGPEPFVIERKFVTCKILVKEQPTTIITNYYYSVSLANNYCKYLHLVACTYCLIVL